MYQVHFSTHKHHILPIFGENIKDEFAPSKWMPNMSSFKFVFPCKMTNYSTLFLSGALKVVSVRTHGTPKKLVVEWD